MNQEETIRFLCDPRSYGSAVTSVEKHETHGAVVFLAGDRAYKLKRAVRFAYLDYSTAARRRRMCEAELSVNRRTAPELYLGVKSIVRAKDSQLKFGNSDDGAAVDWVVVMRRFDQSQLLEEMRKRDALTAEIMRDLADRIAEFHRKAQVAPTAIEGAAAILEVVDENVAILKEFEGRPFVHGAIDRYRALVREAHRQVRPLLDRRKAEGYVRSCHGDLHLNNICLIDGKPVLFDAIEFNERFSAIDVLYDFAFLLMDLEHRRLRGLCNFVFNRYLEDTGDYCGLAALPLFLSCRAAVRAHVTATLASQTIEATQRTALLAEASTLLDDSISYLCPTSASLVAIGGVSGTGKSTLARGLAPEIGRPPGAVVLRSDVIRKQLFGKNESEKLPPDGYDPQITERVYGTICDRATSALSARQSVIADAVFGSSAERESIERVAERAGAPFRGLWLSVPEHIAECRVLERRGDASDATVEVLHQQLRSVEVPGDWVHIEVGNPTEACLARIRTAIRQG